MEKKNKIVLVNPACLDERISGEDARIVPIGLYYIAAQLLDKGFGTAILNLADLGSKNPADHFTRIITEQKPDIIGFSVINPNRWNAIDCAKAAKKILPDTHIVFGGPCPTFLADHLFKVCPELDTIVKGEGELSFAALVNAIENQTSKDTIPGLVFRKGPALFQTPKKDLVQDLVQDLDTLVHPSTYFTFQHLAMSRGCPGKCTFCGSPKFWNHKTIRFHSPQWFAQEIQTLFKKGVTHFYISDDTFTMDKNRVLALCELLIQKKLPITWNAISRVDYIDEDIVYAMRKAGCIQISFGVESGSPQIRKTLGKPIDQQKIIAAFSLVASYGILPRAYFIYGSPGETQKTIQESMTLWKAIKPLSAIFYMLVIFPGTHLYAKMVQKNQITDDIWHKKIEDLPWFEMDDHLDFKTVKAFGDQLRTQFYSCLEDFAKTLELVDKKDLYPFHADFLSRLAMTFSHGEYSNHPLIKTPDDTAVFLYEKALSYAQDARAILGLAMLFQKKKQFDTAIAHLQKGLALWPQNPDLNICMGVCLMNKQQFAAALSCFEKWHSAHGVNYGIDPYINICNHHLEGE